MQQCVQQHYHTRHQSPQAPVRPPQLFLYHAPLHSRFDSAQQLPPHRPTGALSSGHCCCELLNSLQGLIRICSQRQEHLEGCQIYKMPTRDMMTVTWSYPRLVNASLLGTKLDEVSSGASQKVCWADAEAGGEQPVVQVRLVQLRWGK